MAFLLSAVALGMDIAILGIENIAFGRPGASTLTPSGHFGGLGTPLRTMGAAAWTLGVQNWG